MEVRIPKGKYVVAVSGGVDSVVLLDLLARKPGLELIVAHFDHGIREDSTADARFVAGLAKSYGLIFEVGRGKLSKNASEEAARTARYKFLEAIRTKHKAKAIVTAHHQDDWIETAMINLLRGTGPQGLVAIYSNPKIVRPMLNLTKKEVIAYASSHKLQWREDETNLRTDYLRNYLRRKTLAKMTKAQRVELMVNLDKVAKKQRKKEMEIATLSQLLLNANQLDRRLYIQLPVNIGREVLASWLKNSGCQSYDKKKLELMDAALRTGRAGTSYAVTKNLSLKMKAASAQLTSGLI